MINTLSGNLNVSQKPFGNIKKEKEYINKLFDSVKSNNVDYLNSELKNIKDTNGCFLSAWNSLKTSVDIGISDKNCDEAIEAYKKGEIDFEEANKKIKEYSFKQESGLNLLSNITASVMALGGAAVAASIIAASGGVATPFALAAAGAVTGAITKAGFKFIDRASNAKENDENNLKQIVKDSLSGAVAGGIAVVTMGTAASATSVANAVKSCGITGIKTGTVSCSSNYAIDSAFDENKQFDISEFAQVTAEGAVVGGSVGAIMGWANANLHATGLLNSGCNFKTFRENAGHNSINDVAANSACTAQYKILNDRIRSTYT